MNTKIYLTTHDCSPIFVLVSHMEYLNVRPKQRFLMEKFLKITHESKYRKTLKNYEYVDGRWKPTGST